MALPIDQQPSQVGTYEKYLPLQTASWTAAKLQKKKQSSWFILQMMIPWFFAMADKIRQHFNDNSVDVCAIVNARSGKCPENCKLCAQSAHHQTGVQEYPFMDESILQAARKAKEASAIRFPS